MDANDNVMPPKDIAADTKIGRKGMPVDGTGSGVAVSDGEENSKNPDFLTAPTCWYVAKVKAYQGKNVKLHIRKKKLPIEAWIATQSMESRWTDRMKEVEKYLFPSYVFFKFTDMGVNKRRVFSEIFAVPYVCGILTLPGESEPAKIPERQIRMLRQMLSDRHREVSFVEGILCKGDRVRVTGLENMEGVEGEVEKVSENESNIYVAIDYLGYATLRIERKYLAPIIDKPTAKDTTKQARPSDDGRIVTADWLALHPYSEMMPVDKRYLAFANDTARYIGSPLLRIPKERRNQLALRLAAYVEDKRSDLRLFSTFVALTRKGKKMHPVENLLTEGIGKEAMTEYMAGYTPKGINAIDLCCFLVPIYGDKGISLDELFTQGTRICKALKNMGCAKLPKNDLYADDRRSLLLYGGWRGLKRFVEWTVNGPHYLSRQAEKRSVAEILADGFTAWDGISPKQFALTFARKSRMGDGIADDIKHLKVLPPTLYDVLDNENAKKGHSKKFLLKRTGSSHTSKVFDVVYDEISTEKYEAGESYTCQLARYGEDWHLLSTPIKYHA